MEKGQGVCMSQRELFVFEQLQKFLFKQMTRAEVSQLLGVTERTVTRMARRIEAKGMLGVKHGNALRRPKNKTSELVEQHVKKLILNQYFDRNMTHIFETLREGHGVRLSFSTIARWCKQVGVTKRSHKKRQVNNRKRRPRMSQEGFMLQMDGSPHMYVPHEEWVLIAAIDDATNKIAAAEFYKSETTFNCMDLLSQVITAHGVPWCVYVDRAGWLGGGKRAHFGEFRRACEDLGIEVIFANSPQGKGRIERWFQVPQDRLVAELRTAKITEMKQANVYLKEHFIKGYWNVQKTLPARISETKYREKPSEELINEAFTMREYRKVNYDNTFRWKTNDFQILNPPVNLAGREVELRFYRDGKSTVYFANQILDCKLIKQDLKRIAA